MKWNNMSVISVFLLNLIYQIGSGLAHKCFVCGPDSGKYEDVHELKRTFPDTEVPLCSKYSGKMREAFIRECPTSSSGCLTQIEGGSIMRTCAPIKIDDCKIANAVSYCYCSTDKCNTPDRRLSDPAPPVNKQIDDFGRQSGKQHSPHSSSQTSPPDDEDNTEGSAGWASFYYDNYYDEAYDLGYGDPGKGFHDDTVDGEDPGDYADMTDPPPFIQQELDRENDLIHKDKKHKEKFDKNEFVFDDDDKRRNQNGGGSGACGLFSSSVLLILSFALLARL